MSHGNGNPQAEISFRYSAKAGVGLQALKGGTEDQCLSLEEKNRRDGQG